MVNIVIREVSKEGRPHSAPDGNIRGVWRMHKCPILLEAVPIDECAFTFSGGLYHREQITQWLGSKSHDPLTNLAVPPVLILARAPLVCLSDPRREHCIDKGPLSTFHQWQVCHASVWKSKSSLQGCTAGKAPRTTRHLLPLCGHPEVHHQVRQLILQEARKPDLQACRESSGVATRQRP